jgi:Spy/CpxP family protein refolding chaperone
MAAIVVVIVAFFAGILVGVAGDRFYLVRGGRLAPRHARFSSERMADHLRRELSLTPTQKTQIQSIIEHHHATIEAAMTSVRPVMRRELDATNAEIDTVLTPDQRTKFASLRMRVEARRRERRGVEGEQQPAH